MVHTGEQACLQERFDGAGNRGILFLLPHPDDEFFFAPRIRRAAAEGKSVYCAFLTDGTWYGVAPETRMRESTRALGRLGVAERNLRFLGVRLGIRDGYAHLEIDRLYEALLESVRALRIEEIYVLAWEGGHPDHDTSHLVGAALAGELGVGRIHECPGYNAYKLPPPLFHVMRSIPREEAVCSNRLTVTEGLACFSLCTCYRSQFKTFVGLAPESFYRLVVLRRHERRRVAGIDYTRPPHAGALFYEKRFHLSFDEFHAATAGFVSRHGLGITANCRPRPLPLGRQDARPRPAGTAAARC